MATPIDENALEKIKQYAKQFKAANNDRMEIETPDLEARLDDTIQSLQNRVKEQQSALEQLRTTCPPPPLHPSSSPRERLQQLHNLTTAYKAAATSPPIPSPNDPILPSLLAALFLHQTISGTKDSLETTSSSLQRTHDQLSHQTSQFQDQQVLQTSLQSRITQLHQQSAEQATKTPSQIAKELIQSEKEKKKDYTSRTKELKASFDAFVDDHLASMLAAEELGGPIVGSIIDVEDDILAAGFSSQGKAKSTSRPVPVAKRQRRIDEIWGHLQIEGDDEEPLEEKEAAGLELKQLFKALLEALVVKEGGGPYVRLERDSAAARFLVRSKIAVFHPQDAQRLRLIDFGREFDG